MKYEFNAILLYTYKAISNNLLNINVVCKKKNNNLRYKVAFVFLFCKILDKIQSRGHMWRFQHIRRNNHYSYIHISQLSILKKKGF